MNLPQKIIVGVLGAVSLVSARFAADWVADHTWRAHRYEQRVVNAAELQRQSVQYVPQQPRPPRIMPRTPMPDFSRVGRRDGGR